MAKAFEALVKDIQLRLHAVFLKKADRNPGRNAIAEATKIPWSWVAVNIANVLSQYPTGLTDSVLLSILELKWEKAFIKRFKGFDKNFSTIQAVYDNNIADTLLLEVTAKRWETIQQTKNYQITVVDESCSREMDMYMHPKFSQWIAYNELFFQDRKIRMICPPKINSVITNKYKDETFDRHHRVTLIPPTVHLVLILDRFDKDFCLKEFPHKIRDIQQGKKEYGFWLKIIHVENTPCVTTAAALDPEEGAKLKRTDIFLVDMSSESQPAILYLYDKQTALASIFRRNDYVGVFNPLIKASARGKETVFEYANDTVFFLMPEKEAQEAGLAKIDLASMIEEDTISCSDPSKKDIAERDEEGFMDCSNYSSRIYVKDLVHCMLNVTLFGKVIALASNNPFIDKNKISDRYALRIADSTGTMDITLWEDAGRDTRRLRIGQYVLLDNLTTSDKRESGNRRVWYVNGSVVCGTKMYNITTLSCLLASAPFRSIIPLWHAKETKNDHFQMEGIVTGWELHLESLNHDQFVLSDIYSSSQTATSNAVLNNNVDFMDCSIGDRITALAHVGCLLPHKTKNQTECEFCGCQIENDVVHIFRPKPGVAEVSDERGAGGWIEWRLDDGTSTCKAYGCEETLLNVTAHHFKLMSHKSQINLLDSVIGLPILCSLSGTSTSTYRLDQMTLLEPTQQECRDMLEAMDKK